METTPQTPLEAADRAPRSDDEVLAIINEKLVAMGDQRRSRNAPRWIKMPSLPEGCERLAGVKTLLVDDTAGVVENYIPLLNAATRGEADAIVYREGQFDATVADILVRQPDLLLLDHTLSWDDEEGQNGPRMVAELRRQNFAGGIVGFSSEGESAERFARVGVTEFVDKVPMDGQEAAVGRVAESYARLSADPRKDSDVG